MGGTRAGTAQASVTLDTGALIALDRGERRMIALLQLIAQRRGRVNVPTGVVAQAWRDGSRQARLARFLRSAEVEICDLDSALARACGELCAATGTSDVIDASVVILAREHGDAIVTSDLEDMKRLDPTASLQRV